MPRDEFASFHSWLDEFISRTAVLKQVVINRRANEPAVARRNV